MAMTFGSFVSREDASHLEGAIAPQQVEIVNTTLSDAVEDGKSIQSEIVEMENAEQVIQQMEQTASDNAVNIAAAQGQPAPEAVTDSNGEFVAPVNPESEPVLDQNSTPAEANNLAAQTVATVESLMGNIKLKHSKYTTNLGLRGMPSCESLIKNRNNGLKNLIIAQESLTDTIKDLYKKVKDYILKIVENIRKWLAKYIPFFKNYREKGEALKKRAADIKRPELKSDKDFEPSDRFIVVKWCVKDFNKLKEASKKIGQTMVTYIKNANDAKTVWTKLREDSSIQASAILSDLSKADVKIVGAVESNNSYEPGEIAMGTLSSNLTFPGLVLDPASVKEDNNYKSEFTVKTLRLSVSKKDAKTKFKMTASEFKSFATQMGNEVEKSWRVEDELKKLNDELKKACNDLDKKHAAVENPDEKAKKYMEGQSDLMSAARAVMQAIMSTGTYPDLLIKVGNEALDQIKDGDKE